MNHVDAALSEFNPQDYTVRICHAIFKTLPFAPEQPEYHNLDGAISALYPQGGPAISARAHQLAESDEVKSALWVARAIDAGDEGLAVYSGLKGALGFFFGNQRKDALESDPQQGLDAGLKLLGLAYMVHKLFPGGITQQLEMFNTTPAGRALGIYYGAVEVALPFADNVVQGGGDFVQRLMGRYGSEAGSKLGAVLGGEAQQAAQGMVGHLLGPMQGVVTQVGPYASHIAQAAKQYVPGFMASTDAIAGVVATGADALPVYKYLGARLAAEACVLAASRGLLAPLAIEPARAASRRGGARRPLRQHTLRLALTRSMANGNSAVLQVALGARAGGRAPTGEGGSIGQRGGGAPA